MKPPCVKDCPHRHGGCAASCPEWAKYVEKRNQDYARRLQDAEITTAVCEGRIRRGSYDPGLK
jgi:hypothetical protein